MTEPLLPLPVFAWDTKKPTDVVHIVLGLNTFCNMIPQRLVNLNTCSGRYPEGRKICGGCKWKRISAEDRELNKRRLDKKARDELQSNSPGE
jgi:hypothetical protein